MWVKADRETIALIKKVKQNAQRNKTPFDLEFMEFTPKNHMKVRTEIKERCNKLREFNSYWWTKVVPRERGNPNYQIEVSHVDCKKFISVNYDTFMSIPLDKIGPEEPNSDRKGKEISKAYQDPEDLKIFKDTIREINQKIEDEYTAAFNALKEHNASCVIQSRRNS